MAATLPPTPDELRARSPILTAKFPAPAANDPDPLETSGTLPDALAQVGSLTGRIMDPAHPELAASTYTDTPEPVPAGLIPLAIRATTLMGEAIAVTAETKLARRRASRLRLRGFSAGPYNETYWDPAMVRGGARGRPQFVDDPDLDDALWALATENARFMLIYEAGGQPPAAAAPSAFDFNRRAGIGLQRGTGPAGPSGIENPLIGPDGF